MKKKHKNIHLRLDCYIGYKNEHPEDTMKRFGITYQQATPQSVASQWIFWNCENIPNPLPEFIDVWDKNPKDYLSKEDADKINNYGN